MFETMQSFLAFFFPTLALIILGILFEEKLIAFEQKLFAALFGKRGTAKPQPAAHESSRHNAPRPALRRVETGRSAAHRQKNRAA